MNGSLIVFFYYSFFNWRNYIFNFRFSFNRSSFCNWSRFFNSGSSIILNYRCCYAFSRLKTIVFNILSIIYYCFVFSWFSVISGCFVSCFFFYSTCFCWRNKFIISSYFTTYFISSFIIFNVIVCFYWSCFCLFYMLNCTLLFNTYRIFNVFF